FPSNPSRPPVTLKTRIEQKSSQTLLEFLCNRFSYHNEDEWIDRIQNGQVLVNDHASSKDQPLRQGDEIAYTTEAWDEPEVNTNYRIVCEDDELLVISKPAPLPVHAIGVYFQNTLMHLLRQARPEAENFQLVHRLDSETSGLLLLVKDKRHLKTLQRQWESGEVQKTYQAIVFGHFHPAEQKCELPIGSLKGSAIRMKLGIDKAEGKSSTTDFKILETKGGFSLVEAKPRTGRTHQIRVHLENLGFPIVGDKLYSGSDETFLKFIGEGWSDWLQEKVLLKRSALHALRLEFTHPVKGNRMMLEDPLPEDLGSFWKGLK
ncbi:MAG TPA: RluA family pseudouridine synthase, partial [bacterium]|nr:RluA family pseudouridine synthase [bacterium]